MDRLTKSQLEFMNGYVPANIHDIYEYATGGGIHIKPSHEGRFTAYKKRTGKTTEEALHSKDPHVRQMANFARNAAKWHHQEGGTAGSQDQIVQQIAQALQKGAKPQQILQELVKMGMPQDQATQTIQAVMQKMQGQMQEGGPAPEEMAPQGQAQQPMQEQPQGGQQDPQQLIQAIQQELQQGAKPEQVIAELLQQQIDPQMIVQIFVQLGMPQEQVTQVIQAVAQQMQQGQEQQNPQEQGQEEPQAPTMAYGGMAHFDYGGYNNYIAPGVLDYSKFNSNVLGANSLADPSVSSIPYMTTFDNPISAALGIGAGALAAGAGSYAGYAGLFHNNKKDYGQFFHNASEKVSNIPPSMNLSKSTSPEKMWDKYGTDRNSLWDKYNPKKNPFPLKYDKFKSNAVNPNISETQYDPNNPISGASTNKLYGAPSIPMQQYGGLPHAQEGLNFKDPYGMQDSRFGQTANYSDTLGYGYANPGINNSNVYGSSTPGQTVQLTDEDVNNENNGYAYPKYAPKVNKNSVNTNKKTLSMSGQRIATNALNGLGMIDNGLAYFDQKQKRSNAYTRNQQLGNSMNGPVYNSPNANGTYTVNSGKLKPNMYTPIQDFGTSQYAKYGGSTQYQKGGEYHVTHDELLHLMRNGAEVEFL